MVQVGKLRLRESGFQLDRVLLPSYQRGHSMQAHFGPPGSQHLGPVFEFPQRPIGGSLGIWCGSWKHVCIWMLLS